MCNIADYTCNEFDGKWSRAMRAICVLLNVASLPEGMCAAGLHIWKLKFVRVRRRNRMPLVAITALIQFTDARNNL